MIMLFCKNSTMKILPDIEISAPGTWVASNGKTVTFSDNDLQLVADGYDPALHEAPICIGHPKDNLPAYGWIKSVTFKSGVLFADGHDVDGDFSVMLSEKKFKKRSSAFYEPDAPGNPKPGQYYLRHVAFLGAMPPAVKGLKDLNLSASDDGVVEFGDYEDVLLVGLLRKLKNFLIGEFGQERIESILPESEIQYLNDLANQEKPDDDVYFNEGAGMSEEEKAKLLALESENARLKQQVEAGRMANVHNGNVAFAEGLVAAGKVLPVNKDTIVGVLNFLELQDQVVEFSDGGVKKQMPSAFKDFLTQLPKSVELSEFAPNKKDGVVDFSAPSGLSVDSSRLELHAKIVAYQQAHKCTYAEAITGLGG